MEPTTTATTFGEALRELRDRFGLTQFDVAERSGISQSTISALETGKQRPWPSTRRNLAAAFDLSLAEFDRITSPADVQSGGPTGRGADAAGASLRAGAGSDTVIRLVETIHRLEDLHRTASQELSMFRRVVEALPILMWRTDASLRLTSMIGWSDYRTRRLSRAVGRGVDQDLAVSFGKSAEDLFVNAHQQALQGTAADFRIDDPGGEWLVRVEPTVDAFHSINGTSAIATFRPLEPTPPPGT